MPEIQHQRQRFPPLNFSFTGLVAPVLPEHFSWGTGFASDPWAGPLHCTAERRYPSWAASVNTGCVKGQYASHSWVKAHLVNATRYWNTSSQVRSVIAEKHLSLRWTTTVISTQKHRNTANTRRQSVFGQSSRVGKLGKISSVASWNGSQPTSVISSENTDIHHSNHRTIWLDRWPKWVDFGWQT